MLCEQAQATRPEYNHLGMKTAQPAGIQLIEQQQKKGGRDTQEFPIQSWNLIGPDVVLVSKSGAGFPTNAVRNELFEKVERNDFMKECGRERRERLIIRIC